VALLPSAPVVYRFRDERGVVMYLGRAVDLRRRVGSYWTSLGDRRRLVRMVARIASVEAVPCDSPHEAAWLERNLLERALPRFNKTRGGEELPGYLRLDLRTRTCGVAAVHTADTISETTDFGPYLGGTRLRLAASALNRLFPLRLASCGLTGSERDMASARGISTDDRARLPADVIAVLERDDGAVTAALAELCRRRDAASERLAFEIAARLQAEVVALAWVSGEQKVTTMATTTGHADLDLHGWSDGVLVSFELRDGQVRRWTQRACTEATGRARVAQTPPRWQPFVTRAAELAGRISTS
jgi:excinuclease ABC subunit C